MEHLSSDDNFKEYNKVLFIVKFAQKSKLLFGRGSNWDIILNYKAISKFQAYFTLKKDDYGYNTLWIEDTLSKYGSYVLNTSPMEATISSDHLCVRIGRALLGIQVKSLNQSWLCFFKRPFKVNQGVDVNRLKPYLSDELKSLISYKSMQKKLRVFETQARTKARYKNAIYSLYHPSEVKSKSNPLINDTKCHMVAFEGNFTTSITP